MSIFARSFSEAGGVCTDSTVQGKYRPVVSWSCLRFLFRPSIATACRSDIYRAILTWVPRLPMLRFGDRRGVRLLDRVDSPQSADHANLGELVGKGVVQNGRSSVERFATFWGIHGDFGTTLIIKPTF